MITLITPTCDRPEAFSLCEFWMSRQTYDGEIQWIVVDDGNTPVCTTQGQEYIRREPGLATQHSLRENFLEGLKHSKGDKIFVIEDDVMIGMRAVVLNGCTVGKESIVAAGAVIPEGTTIPPRSLVMGIPGKVMRSVTARELERIAYAWQHYVEASKAFRAAEST